MNVLSKINSFIISKWILIFFAYDFLSRLFIYFGITKTFFYYAILFKLLIVLPCILQVTFISPKKYNLLIRSGILLLILFFSNQLILFKHLTIDNINHNFYYLLNCLLPLFFVNKFNFEESKNTIYLFINFLILNSLVILCAFFFDLDIFRSYFQTQNMRFGYSGMLLYHWEVGYLYFMGAYLSYFLSKQSLYKYRFSTALFILILFILGTKKGVFLGFLFVVYLFFKELHSVKRVLKKQVVLKITVSLMAFLLIFKYFIKDNLLMFYEIYIEDGFWSSFLSYRNESAYNFISFLDNRWTLINVLVGGPLMDSFKTELELLDIFLLFGLFGLIIYSVLLKKFVNTYETLIFSIFLLLAAFFSGNFFSSVNVVTIYFISTFFMSGYKRSCNNSYENPLRINI